MRFKTCGGCGITKPTNAFHKRSGANDGLQAYCKLCKQEMDAPRWAERKQARAT